jgi:hypothetical protein
MNTLSDLRSTLDEHAEGVSDGEAVARTAAVHHRVSVVRRRRRAVAAGGLSLALVLVGAATFTRRGQSDALPAAPTVLGVKAPVTMTSLGYSYRTDGKGASFDTTGSVEVPKSVDPQLYSWTASHPTRVTLELPDREVWHSDVIDFHDYVVIPPGESGTLSVSVEHGRVGLASYDLTDAIPAGAYSKDGITFRPQVDGAPLLRGVVTDPGQVDLTSSYVVPNGPVALRLVCGGLPKGDAVHVSLGGRVSAIADPESCGDVGDFDPGSGNSSTQPRSGRPGTSQSVRIWVTSGVKDLTALAPGSVPGLQVGLGIYGPVGSLAIGGYQVPQYVEHGGHVWRLSRGMSKAAGQPGRHLFLGAALVDRVAQVAFHTHGLTRIEFRAGDSHGGGTFSGGKGGAGGFWAPAFSAVNVHLARGDGSFGAAVYERTD